MHTTTQAETSSTLPTTSEFLTAICSFTRGQCSITAKSKAPKSSLANGPSSAGSETSSSLQPRSVLSLVQSVLYSFSPKVHNKLRGLGHCDQAKDPLYGKQCQVNAYQCTSQLEEAENDVHRHSLRALVGLGHFHRGSNEWSAHARSTRKSALSSTC